MIKDRKLKPTDCFLSFAKCFVPFKRLGLAFWFRVSLATWDLKAWFNMFASSDSRYVHETVNAEPVYSNDLKRILRCAMSQHCCSPTLRWSRFTRKSLWPSPKLWRRWSPNINCKRFEYMIKCMRTQSQLRRSALCRGCCIIWMQIRKPVSLSLSALS